VDTDARLIEEAQGGGEEAFLRLYATHRTPLFRFAWRMTGSIEVAEDVTQECFLSLMRGATFDAGQGSLRSWLFGTARNLVFRHFRISGRETEEPAEASGPVSTLDDLLALERAELVQRAIANLPALQREAIILFEYEELSLESIASVTGAQVGAIKARLQRARESLRKQLGMLLTRDTERRSL
jgi:RNA polymerase sigma factor (sigma-70 family)